MQPGSIANNVPDGDDWIARKLRELEREIDALRTARTLEAATIGEGGLTVAGGAIRSANFDGDVDANQTGANGWALGGPAGNAIFNNITLRGGIVGDDALSSVLKPVARNAGAQAFPLSSTAITSPASLSLPRPAGFTTALVLATVDLTVYTMNSTAGSFSCRAAINGNFSPFGQTTKTNVGGHAFVSNTYTYVLTGLTGNVLVEGQLAANEANIPASDGNFLNVNAFALFLR